MQGVAGQWGQHGPGGQHGLTAAGATSAQQQVVPWALPWDRNLLERQESSGLLGHPGSACVSAVPGRSNSCRFTGPPPTL